MNRYYLNNLNIMFNFYPGSEHRVEVTHINDPSSFYVRLLSDDNMIEYNPQAINAELKILAKRGKKLPRRLLRPNLRVIYKSKILKKYVRGDIEAIYQKKGTKCTINAIDYGCCDTNVRLKYIYSTILPSSVSCPPLAQHCELAFCFPIYEYAYFRSAIEIFKNFSLHQAARMVIRYRTSHKLVVELVTMPIYQDVAEWLELNDCIIIKRTIMRPIAEIPWDYNRIQYRSKEVYVGDKLHGVVQSGRSADEFYVASVSDLTNYNNSAMPLDLNIYCLTQGIADVTVAVEQKTCCGIKLYRPERYERGRVLNVIEQGLTALVQLIDSGREIIVPIENIVTVLSSEFTDSPAISMLCTTTDDQVWETDLAGFFYLGHEFNVTVMELGNGFDIPHKVNLVPILDDKH